MEFFEELFYVDGVFIYEGRENFFTKFCVFGIERFVVIYVSDLFVLIIGCYNGKFFVIDTYLVAFFFGNGNGFVFRGNENIFEVWMFICVWFW